MIKKSQIICTYNGNGNNVFKCSHCDKHISHYLLVGTTYCLRCGRKFKNTIKIVRGVHNDVN